MDKGRKTKLQIIWAMRKWSIKYINWRLITAYPNGLRYAIKHPIELSRDLWNYLNWCQDIDKDIN